MSIDLQKFCYTNKSRPALLTPFTRPDGWTYATDGRICVRTHPSEAFPAGSTKAETLFTGAPEGREAAIPALPDEADERIPCKYCDGTGKGSKVKTCPECGGEGLVECLSCGHEADCDECGGTGDIAYALTGDDPCEECGGKGWTPNEESIVEVGGLLFQSRYMRLVAGLPGVQFFTCGNPSPSRFAFDGGEGVLMPRLKP